MAAAAMNAESSAMASTPLKPYAHQTTAVYGAMPQPLLRFLPGRRARQVSCRSDS